MKNKNRELKNYTLYGCNKVEVNGEGLTETDRIRYILVLTGLGRLKSHYDIMKDKDKKMFDEVYDIVKKIAKTDYTIYVPISVKNSKLIIFKSNGILYPWNRLDWKFYHGRALTKDKTALLLHKIVSEIYCKNNNIKKELVCLTKDMVNKGD